MHTHALPRPLLSALEAAGRADLSGLDQGRLLLDPALSGVAPGSPIPCPVEQYDVDRRLERMDQLGTDVQVVAAPPFLFGSMSTDDRDVLEVTRMSNDALADLVSAAPGRLVGLGTVPVGVRGAAAELERCLDHLGFAGVTMGTFGGGQELDAPVNEDLWSVMSERRTFGFLHPSRASSPERVADYHLLQLLGYPAETALAVSRLVFGTVLDRFDLTLCLAHGGGCLASVRGRLDLGWHRKEVSSAPRSAPSTYLGQLYYDSAVFDRGALGRLVQDVGASRVLLGSDWPFDLADVSALDNIDSLGLSNTDHAAIVGGTARRLLGLGDPEPTALATTAGSARLTDGGAS